MGYAHTKGKLNSVFTINNDISNLKAIMFPKIIFVNNL
jgi:hypothetical protein